LRPLVFILLYLLVSSSLFAQENSDATQVVSVVDTKSDSLANEAANTVTEALKDSLQNVIPAIDTTGIKEEAKAAAKQALKDSLNNYIEVPTIALDSTMADQLKDEAKSRLSEELDVDIPKIDSATLKSEAKSLAKEQLEAQTGIDVPDITLDSTTVDQVQEELESRAEAALKENSELGELSQLDDQLGELKEVKDKIELTQQQIKEKTARKALKQKMTSQAKSYLMDNADKVQQIQSQMGELKQKYSFVPNSNDLSTAKKRSSLKGESFWKRLVIGGNFNISKTNPITIDLSPVLGWKINKVSEVGITGTYRAKFGADNRGINSFENDEVYGFSVFGNYIIFKNFFASLEGENMSKVTGTEEAHQRKWNQTLLVGLGRKFNVAKFLEMQAIISYNFLHNNSDNLYNSPVVFKTGFRIKK
jgi:hypothetical protein